MVKVKGILIKLIHGYQKLPIAAHGACKFYPTCSNYAITAITKYGSMKGTYLSVRRILRCNPFHKGGYDPVP